MVPRGQKPKQMCGKVVYLDQCPLIREIYAPGDPEMYAERAAKALWDAIEQLEAKGLMGEPAEKTAS